MRRATRWSLLRYVFGLSKLCNNLKSRWIFVTWTEAVASCHYQNLALCRVSYSLPSATQKTLGKIKHSAKKLFASVLFLTLGKEFLCRVSFFDTRQRAFCRVSQIQHSTKNSLPSVFSPTLGKDNLKITFLSSKLIQMKKFSTTNLYNSSWCTICILNISSYDKIKINLFIKPMSLS
jgi:hypothetical protein